MSWASSEIVSVLLFLLPGFVAAAVFYSLTSYPKPNEFGQVIQALVFTMLGQSVAWIARQLLISNVSWSISFEATISVLSAVIIALIVAYITNNDIANSFFRRIGLTRENSYPSEWYSAFAHNTDCYVVLHMKDGNRLYGWPSEWPSRPNYGHFRIIEAEWLGENGSELKAEGNAEIYEIIVSIENVMMVEFIKAIENVEE